MHKLPRPPPSDPPIDSRWNWHYRTLKAARRRLGRSLASHVQEAVGPGDPEGDLADRAGEELDQDVARALLGGEGRILAEIDDALRRIELGTYGRCEATGRAIPADRLRALPWCRYLAEIESARERSHPSTPPSHA